MKNLAEWLGVLTEIGLAAFLVQAFPPFTPNDQFRLAPVLITSAVLLPLMFLVHGRDIHRRRQ